MNLDTSEGLTEEDKFQMDESSIKRDIPSDQVARFYDQSNQSIETLGAIR